MADSITLFFDDFFTTADYVQLYDTKERLAAIINTLKKVDSSLQLIPIEPDGGEAARSVHGDEYVDFIIAGKSNKEPFPLHPVIARPGMLFSRPEGFMAKHSLFFFDELTKACPAACRGALLSAAGAYQAACLVKEGSDEGRTAYLLNRPPGHHAFRDFGGGLCFFNNGAIAAAALKERGPVAIIDLDQEHGNGTQAIFYNDPGVLTISLHTDMWPLISGAAHERGGPQAPGSNLNLPLSCGADADEYFRHLEQAAEAIKTFGARSLVVALGFDGHKKDSQPWLKLESGHFSRAAELLSALNLPTVITQEGGYNLISNTACTRAFFKSWLSPAV